MAKTNSDITKSRKRAPETGEPVMVRIQADMAKQLDDWRRVQGDLPGRAEAIRRLVVGALAHPPMVAGKPHKGAAKAKDMARGVINDRLKDLSDEERTTRKGRLLKGPTR